MPKLESKKRLAAGAILACAVLLACCCALVRGNWPVINDISTDLDNPPAFVQAPTLDANKGRDMAYPEAFKEKVRSGYPNLGPLALDVPPAEAFAKALELARAHPRWEITREDAGKLEFEGVATTRLLRFRDDFVARIGPGEGGKGSRVDMRSKSRLGRSDFGANAKRIQGFFAELKAALASG
jgi:uncharacterized protein (DUF1499 family)